MPSSFRKVRHLQRYREITGIFLSHGFGFLFEHLGPDWLPLRRSVRKPYKKNTQPFPEELAVHFRQAMEELGPPFVKFGQILSTRPDLLPEVYIDELSNLHNTVAPIPWGLIQETLLNELGKAPEDIFSTIDPQPLAAASLAQVHAATLHTSEEVVIKVQRPNIIDNISTDLEILSAIAKRAQSTSLGQVYDFIGIVDDFTITLKNELDYRREGRNADRFRTSFNDENYLYIPKVYWDYSTQRVLTLERIRGIKIDDFAKLDAEGYDRQRIAIHSARIIIKEVLEDGFFHADPHPGNFVVMPDEVIGAMDFGMVGHLDNRDRQNLIRLYLAAVALDAEGIVEQLTRMGAVNRQADQRGLERDIRRLLDKYFGLPLKDIRAKEVVEEIMPIAFRHQLRLPSDLWLLGKTLGMMEGVGLKLDPGFDMFAVAKPFVRQLTRKLLLPQGGWGRSLLRQTTEWGDLLTALPGVGNRLLDKADRGELFQLELKNTDQILKGLDRLVTRVALSMLVAALIIGLAMLIPITAAGSLAQGLVIFGFIGIAGLAVWLLVSILQQGK